MLCVLARNIFGFSAAPAAECFGCRVFWIINLFSSPCLFIILFYCRWRWRLVHVFNDCIAAVGENNNVMRCTCYLCFMVSCCYVCKAVVLYPANQAILSTSFSKSVTVRCCYELMASLKLWMNLINSLVYNHDNCDINTSLSNVCNACHEFGNFGEWNSWPNICKILIRT